MKILVTGAAGFIGLHVCERLLARGDEVVGLDNLNSYYAVSLKESRLARLVDHPAFSFVRMDVADRAALGSLFGKEKFERVIHLAGQAGVRYSLENPSAYVDSNLIGFANILEGCRQVEATHLVYASSSSVYGGNTKLPFSEVDNVDHPVSLYAATKKSNELMAHAYSHLFGIPTTGLRFFTVYGPWGRPDMAPILFAKAIIEGKPIKVFNHGNMARDFTYIDDIAEGVLRVLDRPAEPDPDFDAKHPDPATSYGPYRIFNIGNQHPVPLMDFISALEAALGIRAIRHLMPMQPGDVQATFAETEKLVQWVNFRPGTSIVDGVAQFVEWYRGYFDN